MNKYELTIVLDGKAGSVKRKKLDEMLESIAKIYKGKVTEGKDWGVKEMTYKIRKSATGLYLFFEIELDGKGVKALNDKLRVDTEILRYLIVRS